jgi:outer membrane protein OmpA-like peptidoglycan-associated protein
MLKTYRTFFFAMFLFLGLAIAAVPAAAEPVNMLSLQEGVLPVVVPPSYGGWDAENMLDDSPKSGWACPGGAISNNVFVFELVEPTTLERFEFDNASVDTVGSAAKDVMVEVSTASSTTGFSPVLETALADITDGQVFPATAKSPARWVRLTIKNNYGSAQYTELFSFRGFGEKPASAAATNTSGTYDTNYSKFHVLQQGTALTGCYEYAGGLLDGAVDGRLMKFTWREGSNTGPAVMVFAPDGKSFRGFWWHKGAANGKPSGKWDGTKATDEVGGCPHWSGSVGGELKKQLESDKRARIYGINFDTNSDVIKLESKPVLDEVLKLLNGQPNWKLTIEGHTDAAGSDASNQTLSQKRADSVKAYLVKAGVDAGRLQTKGLGESTPVADNGTELGRAQNRRVELVRE